MSIKVDKVTKLYGSQKALDEVSFQVERGQITGLLGPNGAGKTTLMRIITCLIPPTEGQVFVNNINTMEDPVAVRKMLGYLPENNPLYPDMYIREYLEFVAALYKVSSPKKRIEEIIALTGLEPEISKTIGKLSKGFRQRVGLAQALIHDPEVLILDEPTSGLDPNQILEIREVIKRASVNKTIIFSTHIMQEVEALCQRVVIIHKGKIVADDLTAHLSHWVSSSETILVGFDQKVDIQLIRRINGIITVKAKDNNVYEIKAKPDMDIRPALFKFAVDHQLTVLSLQQSEKSLEEIFHEITQNHSFKNG
ncbi:MAG: ABC-type multidrug transport system, ATPase component [Bacteroidetes bacterium 38_7]|nr:MAG: ABC-type multidrug transport system, ATPase component [Bacteroidetes bacterium 38_7]HAL65730.1 gliding motility-associated ABC transporter ATP-binding subunit GldA [Bacteroidales bacterium]HQN98968.1 gliding motility-associated ABC transporter ATP-binding subunit GldA [Bacteroidales bacterium]